MVFQRHHQFGGGGRLAQAGDVARAPRDLAPDTGRFQITLRAILGADPAGGDVGGASLDAQEVDLGREGLEVVSVEPERNLLLDWSETRPSPAASTAG